MTRWLALLLLALPLLARPLGAQTWEDYDYENLEFRGIGLDFGGVWPARVERSYAVGIRADLGLVGPRVRIMPAIRFWASEVQPRQLQELSEQIVRICEKQGSGSCPASLDLGEVKMSDLELAAEAHYLFGTPARAAPYLGGGVGLHLFNGRGEFINDTFVEDLLDTVSPALNVLAGVNVPIGASLQLYSEARYVLLSDVRHAWLGAGVSWALPSPPRPAPAAPPPAPAR